MSIFNPSNTIPMQLRLCIYTYLHIMATMRSNRPMASTKANPRIAYEKSWPLMLGFLATAVTF